MALRPTQNLGDNLRQRRKAVRPKLTLEALAERVGLTNGHLSRIERGQVKRVSPELLEKLAAELGCTTGDLLEEPGASDANLRLARDLLGQVAPEDLPGAVKALRGFVRDEPKPAAKPAAKKRRPDRA